MIANQKKPFKRSIAQTRRLTNTAVKELGAEAAKLRKIAKLEFNELIGDARLTGRQQFTQLGRELVKLGHRLEKIGRQAQGPRRKVRGTPPATHA